MTGRGGTENSGFAEFRILTFDTYGTLIDWESGIHAALRPLIEQCASAPSREAALEAFARAESHHQAEEPGKLYFDLLADTYRSLAGEWSVSIADEEAIAFGRSVRQWPAFDDAPAALKSLSRRFLMATLTNCDRVSYMGSNARLELEWDAIYTAQDVGSYKPDRRNFAYLLERVRRDFGVLPHQILHVAQSLTHDHVPATAAGLATVWIDRRHDQDGFGATLPPSGNYRIDWRFDSMAAFAAAVEEEVGADRR